MATFVRRHRRAVAVVGAAAVLAGVGTGITLAGTGRNKPLGDAQVGRQPDGSVLTSVNQYVTPAGDQIEQSGRPMDLAIRPDGQTAVDLTKSGAGLFTVLDLVHHTVLQQYTPPRGTGSGNIGVVGLLYSPDGDTLWATQSRNLLRFPVQTDGTLGTPTVVPVAPSGTQQPLPTGLAWAPDGSLLVVLNGNNSLGVLDPSTGALRSEIAVGNAPRDVVVVGAKAYVSNEAGRRAGAEDFTNLSYDTPVVADRRTGRAASGTVSQVDLASSTVSDTYTVGLDPSSLLAHGTEVLVTNSNDDSVSIIDTTTGEVAQTIDVNPLPGQPFGSSPNALAFLDERHLVVSLGRDNALAVYGYSGPRTPASFEGLIPTAWYPGRVLLDEQLGRLVVANQHGVGALDHLNTISQGLGTQPATGKQVYADRGSISLIPLPTAAQMRPYTAKVFANNQWYGLARRNQKGTGSAKPMPVPVRIGDPSPIKHVFLIVKENRTYDQVLGDDRRGNGDPTLTQFGRNVTPNAHALARFGPLVDNQYSSGTNSAVGHTWLTAAFVNDYLERSYANYVRNYGQPDALVYPKSGFIWENAQRHGLTVADWGEYAEYYTGPDGRGAQGTWQQWYHDSQVLEGKAPGPLHVPLGYYKARSDIPSVDRTLHRNYPNFNTRIPDQYRADLFLRDLKRYEKKGTLPALNMMWVMCDHTSGTSPGNPTPSAQVADNDLAVGRIVEAISHSKFWKSTAIFMVEDDSQNGVDHVDGHRSVTLIASPYAKRGVVHTYYSQLNVTRTIEQILGLPPMNQLDLAAVTMREAFTARPTSAPYRARPNRIPLNQFNPAPAQLSGLARTWALWSSRQDFTSEDELNMDASNRLIWYATHHFATPYPGDSAVLTPTQALALHPAEAKIKHSVTAPDNDD